MRPAEIILIDDASGDDTVEVLRSIKESNPSLIKIISHKNNQGVSVARNTGWDLSTQPYIAFLDADDAWHRRKIETQYTFMSHHPDIVMSGHGHIKLKPDDACLDWSTGKTNAKPISKLAILISNRFITPSIMIKRDIPFRFSVGKRYMEDHLLWAQIICAGWPVVKMSSKLAAIFKFPYGISGLSAQVDAMSTAEKENFIQLYRERAISQFVMCLLLILSSLKLLKRKFVILINKIIGNRFIT